jgi:hypothetical protein
MALSPEDAFARSHGFADAQELEACREASLECSLAPADHHPSALSDVEYVGEDLTLKDIGVTE